MAGKRKNETQNPDDYSAYYAVHELHNGRLEWLAEHIRRAELAIHPLVAEKLLSLLEGRDEHYEVKLVRRSDLPPSHRRQDHLRFRDFDLAISVARKGGFQRAHLKRACKEVGDEFGLSAEYVRKRIAKSGFQEDALRIVEAEDLERQYHAGKVDFLGRPILPQTGFAEDGDKP